MQNNNKTYNKEFHFGKTKIEVMENPYVWLPHDPTLQMIKALNSPQIFPIFKGKRVLEIGTGTGIIGIWALKAGAEYVEMTDINGSAIKAIQDNLKENNIDKSKYNFSVLLSDVFDKINSKFDIIISNPPVQPTTPKAHLDDPASKFNETSLGGRYVLDSIIKQGQKFLNKDGHLFLLCSSRQGFGKTTQIMNETSGKENWEIMFEKEYRIDREYHGPYMDYWITQQNKDNDLRVYLKDEKGNLRSNPNYDPKLNWIHRSIMLHASYFSASNQK